METAAHQPTRVPGLDLLRAAAVMAVVVYHFPKSEAQLWLRALSHFGWMGVDLFFVLSGYLIGGQVFAELRRTGRLDARSFYYRRFMRVLPAYFAVLGLYCLGPADARFNPVNDWKYLLFLQNFALPRIFTASWSLCVEEHFYLFFPPLLLALGTISRPKAVAVFGIIFGFGIALRTWLWWQYRPDMIWQLNPDRGFEVFLGQFYYPTYTRLDGIAVGLAVAAVRVFRPNAWIYASTHAKHFVWFGLCLFALSAVIHARRMSGVACIVGFPILSIAFAALIVAAAGRSSLLSVRIPGVEFIARCSYSIYLTHALAIGWAVAMSARLGFSSMGIGQGVVVVAMIFTVGSALYLGVERPILRWRDRANR